MESIHPLFEKLVQAFSKLPPAICTQIINYDRFIQNRTQDFVGRQFIFGAIDEFTKKAPRGYFIIHGDPGIGKSALMAELVKRRGCAHHFNIAPEGINNAEVFLRNICAQLIAVYGLDYDHLPPEASLNGHFLNKLLGEAASKSGQSNKVILLVDALDEVDNSGLSSQTNTLYLPSTLPDGVYIVATMRKTSVKLRIECEQELLVIEHDAEINKADIREFINLSLEKPGIKSYISSQGITASLFVEHMADKSQGNFMYLKFVLPEIERGVYRDLTLNEIPIGLRNYYEDHWRRMRGNNDEEWFDYKLPVIMALTAIKAPVSLYMLAVLSRISDRRRVRSVLEDISQFLHLEQVNYGKGVQRRYSLYHSSFHDFIVEKGEGGAERIDQREAMKTIDSILLEAWYKKGGRITLDESLRDARLQVNQARKQDPDSPYRLQWRVREKIRVGEVIFLQVRLCAGDLPYGNDALYASESIEEEVLLVFHSRGFEPQADPFVKLKMPEKGYSDWVNFELRATRLGEYKIEVTAFFRGVYAGGIAVPVSIEAEPSASRECSREEVLSVKHRQPGEFTLLVRYDRGRFVYTYQLIEGSVGGYEQIEFVPPHPTPQEAVEKFVHRLNSIVRDATGFSKRAAYVRLAGEGKELWNEFIPPALQQIFWDRREDIKRLTILSSGDPIPWEVLYPTAPPGSSRLSDYDAGFLAEQFPIIRWLLGASSASQLRASRPTFVLPEGSPHQAYGEVSYLKNLVGGIPYLAKNHDDILDLFDEADFDLLHFACHNSFNVNQPTGSSIMMGAKSFTPTDVNYYDGRFKSLSPLVFMNACRTDGQAPNYTQMSGWARSFIGAGAGAFIGSLWMVSDAAASEFAKQFYRNLMNKIEIGEAVKRARESIREIPADPTWLAYTLYGDPAAKLSE